MLTGPHVAVQASFVALVRLPYLLLLCCAPGLVPARYRYVIADATNATSTSLKIYIFVAFTPLLSPWHLLETLLLVLG